MSFFTIGNLLTLGIVALALILFRQSDKNSRASKLLTKLSERLKDELAEFAAQKAAAVRDYAVNLDTHQKAAKELMNRLQLNEEAMAAKIAVVTELNEKIKTYESTLGELGRMTMRVQENLTRIQEESAFVEGVGKRVTEAKKTFSSIEEGFADLELRFERENAASLETVSASVMADMKSTISDFRAEAETIERRVEDHRDAISRIEQDREENLARDISLIEKTVQEALEQAAIQADKIEDAALVKLQEQALERAQRFQTVVEEKLRVHQEAGKARLSDMEEVAKEIEREQLAHKEEWKKDIQEWDAAVKEMEGRFAELDGRTTDAVARMAQRLSKAIEEEGQKALAEADAKLAEYRKDWEKILDQENTEVHGIDFAVKAIEERLKALDSQTTDAVAQMTQRLSKTIEEEAQTAQENWETILTRTNTEVKDLEGRLKELNGQATDTMSQMMQRLSKTIEEEGQAALENWETTLTRTNTDVKDLEGRLKELDDRTAGTVSQMTQRLSQTIEEEGQKALAAADAKLAAYQENWETTLTRTNTDVKDLEGRL
jgi:chromosome segregation ATPase